MVRTKLAFVFVCFSLSLPLEAHAQTPIESSSSTTQTITQTSSSTFIPNSLDYVLYADQFSGADICQKATAAFASVTGITSVKVMLPPQTTLSCTNTISVSIATGTRYILEGNGATINFSGTGDCIYVSGGGGFYIDMEVSHLTIVNKLAGELGSATVASGGSSYMVGDVVTVAGDPVGTGGQLTVTAVSSGIVTAFTITMPGSGYTVSSSAVSTTGGSGTGFTVNITTVLGGSSATNGAGIHVRDLDGYFIHEVVTYAFGLAGGIWVENYNGFNEQGIIDNSRDIFSAKGIRFTRLGTGGTNSALYNTVTAEHFDLGSGSIGLSFEGNGTGVSVAEWGSIYDLKYNFNGCSGSGCTTNPESVVQASNGANVDRALFYVRGENTGGLPNTSACIFRIADPISSLNTEAHFYNGGGIQVCSYNDPIGITRSDSGLSTVWNGFSYQQEDSGINQGTTPKYFDRAGGNSAWYFIQPGGYRFYNSYQITHRVTAGGNTTNTSAEADQPANVADAQLQNTLYTDGDGLLGLGSGFRDTTLGAVNIVSAVRGIGILSASVTTGGMGYSVGNRVSVLGCAGSSLAVASVSGGVVTSLNVYATGSGCTAGSGLATSGGAGTGLTVTITTTDLLTLTLASPLTGNVTYPGNPFLVKGIIGDQFANTGAGQVNYSGTTCGSGGVNCSGQDTLNIQNTGPNVSLTPDNGLASPTVSYGGSGYAMNNVVTVSGGTGGTLTVTSIGTGGIVTGLSVDTVGSGYTAGSGIATSGGSGTGLTVAIGIVPSCACLGEVAFVAYPGATLDDTGTFRLGGIGMTNQSPSFGGTVYTQFATFVTGSVTPATISAGSSGCVDYSYPAFGTVTGNTSPTNSTVPVLTDAELTIIPPPSGWGNGTGTPTRITTSGDVAIHFCISGGASTWTPPAGVYTVVAIH